MAAVLGIDAAWTAEQPSGIALFSNASGSWQCLAVAPSYATFFALADGSSVDWDAKRIPGTEPDVAALLDSATRLLGGAAVDVVTVDMPIATCDIVKRRTADDKVSRKFGAAGCAVHSPLPSRPGPLGGRFTEDFVGRGFPVATEQTPPGTVPALFEVYPHTALLTLTGDRKRLPYKIGKKGRTVGGVRSVWLRILEELSGRVGDIRLAIPSAMTKACAKRYEDAIDALICAWVGIEYLEGQVEAYGDETAAIWSPV